MDGGLCCLVSARPTSTAYSPIPVRQAATLLHASFRRCVTATPLRFANPSPPSSWIRDFHPQAGKHAWQTEKPRPADAGRAGWAAALARDPDVTMRLDALDALAANDVEPTVNLKVLLDGEEEAGSPNLRRMLEAYKDKLDADLWLFCDGPTHQSRRWQLVYGVRGSYGFNLTVYGPNRPLHSGHYGNWAPNPIVRLNELLATMRDGEGRILVDGFHDQVVPPSVREQAAIDAAVNGESFGRWFNGEGRLYPMISNTFGAANRGPRVGPVVISEVMYHPTPPTPEDLAIYATLTEDDLEYVEIYNPATAPIDLNQWRIRKGIDFDFVAGENSDVLLSHLARDVCGHHVTILEFDAEHHVGQRVDHGAFHFDYVFFRHSIHPDYRSAASALF